MDYEKTAKEIIGFVGGKDNINTVQNCMTRLRLTLKDEKIVDEESIKALEDVKGLIKAGGQHQIVIGKEVAELCKEVKAQIGYQETETVEAEPENTKMKWYERVMDVLSGSVIPLIGVTIGAGMITALVTLLSTIGVLSPESGTYQFFSAVGNAGLYFLPIFVGYTSAQKFHANPFLGMFLGATLLYPTLTDLIAAKGGLALFGIKLSTFTYGSTMIPVILATWFMSYVEKLAKKICPKVIESFGVPMIIMLITVPVTYLIIGPIGSMITQGINVGVMALSKHAGFLAIGIVSAVMPLLVMSGLHMSLIPIMIAIMSAAGNDPIITACFMVYNIGMAGSCLAIALRSKETKFRQLGISTCISALLGVSEPGLFGVVLALKKPLFATMGGCAISGIIAGFIGYAGYVPMSQSLLSIPAAVTAEGSGNMIRAILVAVISFAICFAANFLWGAVKTEEN